MFPQLGAPIGFFTATGVFLLLTDALGDAQFLAWGWRVPFIASAALVLVGLYVRLKLTETPAFRRARENREVVKIPMAAVLTQHPRTLVLGTLAAIAVFALFYLMTVFTLSWGTTALGFTRQQFLLLQMAGVLFFGACVPLSAVLADRIGTHATLVGSTLGAVAFGLAFDALFGGGSVLGAFATLAVGFAVMGLMYGPLGTGLGELFPTAVRYTGTSVAFNLAGILGGSLAPYMATWLATHRGLGAVGLYLSTTAAVTVVALLLLRRSPASRPAADVALR